jgi:hypothetical protein
MSTIVNSPLKIGLKVEEELKLYYNGYLLPLIDYCSVVWGNTNKVNLEKILKLQKRAARIILRADFGENSIDLCQSIEKLF